MNDHDDPPGSESAAQQAGGVDMSDPAAENERLRRERDAFLSLLRRAELVVLAYAMELKSEPGTRYPDPLQYPLYQEIAAAIAEADAFAQGSEEG